MPDEDVRVSVAEERRGLLDAQPAADAPKKEAKEKEKASALSSWRRIWQEARDVRPALALGCVVLVLASAAFNGLPYLAGKLLDAVTADTTGVDAAAARRRLNSVALQLILLAVISGALSGIRMYIFNSASERVVAHIRGRLFRALLRQELNFFDVNVSGSLLSRITADTELLRDAATTNVSILLRSTANALIGVGMMFWTSWRLTLLALGVTPAVVLFVAHFGRALRQLSKETRAAAAEASSLAGDTLGAIRSVKAFARERAEASLFEVSVQKTLQLGLTTAQRGALFMAFATSVMVSVIATVFWYGGTLVISGRMTVGSLQAFVLYAVAIAGAIGGLSGVVVSLMTAVGASSRVFELLDRVPELAPCGALRPFDGRTCFSAELVDVWFAYPSRPDAWVLRGICILVEEGKTFALCGASGCGKSTIAALIERFYDPQKGTVLLAGVPAQQIETVHLHRALGIVSQEPLLLARSIRDNIAFGVDNATDEEVAAAAAAANASSFIEAYDTKYDTQVGERGVQLSGGQKQRIAIARALLTKPLMLLLDEATSALDAESEAAVVDALERARKGRTALIIAHRLSTVRDADCIAVIGGGVVEEKGVHDALLAQGGTYARLVQRQLASADNLLAELPAAEQSATS